MKRMTSKDARKKAKELATAIEIRRKAEKREKHLRQYFKHEMGTENIAMVGGWLITLDTKTRVSIDREALEFALGEGIHEFERKVSYSILMIRNAKGD